MLVQVVCHGALWAEREKIEELLRWYVHRIIVLCCWKVVAQRKKVLKAKFSFPIENVDFLRLDSCCCFGDSSSCRGCGSSLCKGQKSSSSIPLLWKLFPISSLLHACALAPLHVAIAPSREVVLSCTGFFVNVEILHRHLSLCTMGLIPCVIGPRS